MFALVTKSIATESIYSHEFYRKLVTSSVHPSTAAPSPGDFVKVYEKVAQETDQIVAHFSWIDTLTSVGWESNIHIAILCPDRRAK